MTSDIAVLLLAASGTALATGIGAIPVFVFEQRTERATPFLLGLAAGVMGVAALVGLIIPATEEGSLVEVAVGFATGVVFLLVISKRFKPEHDFMGRTGPGARTSALVFLVLLIHSLPEGLAIGTAFASDRAGLSQFVIVAIAIQNIPEGTSVAIPMQEAGFGRLRQFWAAVATSAPQPIGALIAFLAVEEVSGLLPLSFAFAAGAMLALIVAEVLPRAYTGRHPLGPSAGLALGAAVMLALNYVQGV